MNPTESFQDVIARLRNRDDQAAGEVFRRFAGRLAALARTRLDGAMRQKVDPEDVLQSVYKSFFARHAAGELEVGSWDGLWSLLTVLTVRKCSNCAKFFRAARRDARRETDPGPAEGAGPHWEAIDREPTPEEAVALAETVEQLMRGLDERDRQILTLSLQGETVEEISRQVGYAERTVRRVLSHVRDRLRAEAVAE